MGAEVRERCDMLLRRAESHGRCATAENVQQGSRFRYMAKKGLLISPYPGLFSTVEHWKALTPDQQQRHLMRTLSEVHPEWVFCGISAAIAHGLDVPYAVIQKLELATTDGRASHSSDLTTRRLVSGDAVSIVDGMRVTTLETTVVDCLRSLPFKHGLAIADSVLRDKHVSAEWLTSLLAKPMPGKRGIKHARLVASHADPTCQNGGESQARATFMQLGFERPSLQKPLTDPISGVSIIPDFTWELSGNQTVAGELDGWEKYRNPRMNHGSPLKALAKERQRESRLTLLVSRVMRFGIYQIADPAYMTKLLVQYGIPQVTLPSSMDLRPAGWGFFGKDEERLRRYAFMHNPDEIKIPGLKPTHHAAPLAGRAGPMKTAAAA